MKFRILAIFSNWAKIVHKNKFNVLVFGAASKNSNGSTWEFRWVKVSGLRYDELDGTAVVQRTNMSGSEMSSTQFYQKDLEHEFSFPLRISKTVTDANLKEDNGSSRITVSDQRVGYSYAILEDAQRIFLYMRSREKSFRRLIF